MQQQQHLQQLVAVQQLQRQQQHKQQVKQQQAVKPPQIGVDFSKVAPDVLEGFVNVCPTCGIHSFFSPISLELHKNICAKVLQHEWISYSKVGYSSVFLYVLSCTEVKWREPLDWNSAYARVKLIFRFQCSPAHGWFCPLIRKQMSQKPQHRQLFINQCLNGPSPPQLKTTSRLRQVRQVLSNLECTKILVKTCSGRRLDLFAIFATKSFETAYNWKFMWKRWVYQSFDDTAFQETQLLEYLYMSIL